MTAVFEPIVVVAFSSRCGSTERLALSAAVGAVQARGLIRMRRLPDAGTESAPDERPECREARARMHKHYVPPAERDILSAHALIVGAPPGVTAASPEWQDLLSRLAPLGADGKLAGKVAAVIDAGDAATVASLSSALLGLGFTAPAPTTHAAASSTDTATALGRSAAEAARAIRHGAG